jgi:hypothetical protein
MKMLHGISKIIPLVLVPGLTWGAYSDLSSTFSSDESVYFYDDFDDNSNGWSNIAVENGTGTAASGQATIGTDSESSESVWYASLSENDNVEVISTLDIGDSLDLSDGAISVYLRVRVNTNSVANRFTIGLNEEVGTQGNVAWFSVQPTIASTLSYRTNETGTQVTTSQDTYNFTDTVTFVNFKMTLTAIDEDSMSLDAFVFNTETDSYDSLVSSTVSSSRYDSGIFDTLRLQARFSGTDNLALFDAVAVTQIPEPASYAMFIGLIAVTGAVMKRRQHA